MVIEDSGFGINSIEVIDNSIGSVSSTPVSHSILPSLHAVFTSDGEDNVIREMTGGYAEALEKYGSDFADSKAYGLQNLIAENVMKAGATAYLCRLLPEDAKLAHLIFKVAIKKESEIPLYKRDMYGNFAKDELGNKIPITINSSVVTTDVDSETGESINGENQVVTNAKTSGYRIKLIVEQHSPSKQYTTGAKIAAGEKTIVTSEDDWNIFPLFTMYYYARGKCGNDYGFRLINDFARDEAVNDGRRYELFLLKKTSSGALTLSIGNDLSFSFNPNATVSKTVPTIEGLQKIYQNLDNSKKKKQIQLEYYQDNYDELVKYLKNLLSEEPTITEGIDEADLNKMSVPETVEDFDFINGCDKGGNQYDNVVIDDESVDISTPVYMNGGSDGAIESLSGEALETYRNDMLKKFFKCEIDTPTITNVLKCDAGIIYDANYPLEVKAAMSNIVQNRRDICVVWDTGFTDNLEQACAVAQQLLSLVPGAASENFAIIPHCGITADRGIDVRVTGTYELSSDIHSIYASHPFVKIAGAQHDYGCVRKTIFDWVVEESIPKGYQIKLAKANKLYWATDLGKALSNTIVGNYTGKNVYFFSDANCYKEPISKLAEFRNSLLINDIRRVVKLVLVKYTFDSDGADAAIEKANEDLKKIFKNRYPNNIILDYNLYQSNRDKLLNQASCDISVTFPDVFDSWNCTITANRNGVKEA